MSSLSTARLSLTLMVAEMGVAQDDRILLRLGVEGVVETQCLGGFQNLGTVCWGTSSNLEGLLSS